MIEDEANRFGLKIDIDFTISSPLIVDDHGAAGWRSNPRQISKGFARTEPIATVNELAGISRLIHPARAQCAPI